jgi:hypothetical protein
LPFLKISIKPKHGSTRSRSFSGPFSLQFRILAKVFLRVLDSVVSTLTPDQSIYLGIFSFRRRSWVGRCCNVHCCTTGRKSSPCRDASDWFSSDRVYRSFPGCQAVSRTTSSFFQNSISDRQGHVHKYNHAWPRSK